VPEALSAEEIRDVNTRYHDVAAAHYDSKWGIDFGDVGREQVLVKVRKAVGHMPDGWGRALEIGAGTGYFTLNLLRAGMIGEATCSDISPGMLSALRANAERLGLEVRTELLDAERLPFAEESFDLVRRAIGARPAPVGGDRAPDAALEGFVDVHAFAPGELQRAAAAAGLVDVRITGEELLANWFGWTNRTLEATAEPGDVPWAWRQYAYRGYLLLQELDRRLLESRLPPAIFYNLLISARKPRGR
jgi:SAM-dependent methyltransferase